MLPELGFPEWTVTGVIALAVALLPPVLILAWSFDITGSAITMPASWRVDPEASASRIPALGSPRSAMGLLPEPES